MEVIKSPHKPITFCPGSRLANRLPENLVNAIALIARGGRLGLDELLQLTDNEKEKIEVVITTGMLTLAGQDREDFFENIDPIMSDVSRNETWERNHWAILNSLDYLTRYEGKVPTVTRIAKETNLSRYTVSKHLDEYYTTPAYKEKANSLQMLRERLLTKMYKYGFEGDVRAAKVYLDNTTGSSPLENTKIQNQQNNIFIQFGSQMITQEQLNNLPPEKQQQLKEILSLLNNAA